MLDLVRTSLNRLITSPVGDTFTLVRLPKDLARRANLTLGSPLCSAEELQKRRAAELRLAELRRAPRTTRVERPAAPVVVYFEKDRNARLLSRVEEFLDSKGIAYTKLDVTGDEATMAFVLRQARCKEDELPIVFVAGDVVGDYNALVAHDVAGKLAKAVFGA